MTRTPPPASTGIEPAWNVTQAVPFFWVTDLAASLKYYVDGLGFTVKREWTHEGKLRWCWLQLGDAAIMLQEFAGDDQHAGRPTGVLGQGVTIYFLCHDALAISQEITARGVSASRPVVGNGMWVTDTTDPDGYLIHFESPTDAAEDSVHEG